MKKIGLLAGLCCMLTVSGVYATWVYAQASAGSVSESIIPQMAGVGESSKKGAISVKTSGLTMVIDDGGSYKPKLIIEGSVSIEFTEASGADSSVAANGIKMAYSLSMTDNWQYDSDGDGIEDKDIFVFDNSYVEGTDIALNGGAPSKSLTITSAEISQYIVLNVDDNFKLDTRAKYDAFKDSLNQASSLFTVTVKEVE